MAIITDGVRTKFTDDTGLPLIGGQVFSYVEGTSTPKDTYQDRAFTIPNTNPIILDDVGSCEMYLKGGYRLRVLTTDGVLVEEKDNAFQSDGQVLDVVANTTAIAALQTNVDVLNTRGGLKTDENNHIIGQGKAESATVYDLSLRSDKIRVSAPTDVEFGDLVFKTYDAPTVANGVTIPTGTWLNPALVVPLLGTAATKDAGTAVGNVMQVGAFGWGSSSASPSSTAVPSLRTGLYAYPEGVGGNKPSKMGTYDRCFLKLVGHTENYGAALFIPYYTLSPNQICLRTHSPGTMSDHYFWTDRNTTVDGNGFIKKASPILRLYADKLETNQDVNQEVSYIKNGIGDYTIVTESGLSTNGWYLELPKDLNGNPKVAVTLTEADGVISLKSYKRIFSMETFTFEPDLDNPLDIPDGRWIDLRLNEMPSMDDTAL